MEIGDGYRLIFVENEGDISIIQHRRKRVGGFRAVIVIRGQVFSV